MLLPSSKTSWSVLMVCQVLKPTIFTADTMLVCEQPCLWFCTLAPLFSGNINKEDINILFFLQTWFLGALWPNSTSLFTYLLWVDSDKRFVHNLWHTKRNQVISRRFQLPMQGYRKDINRSQGLGLAMTFSGCIFKRACAQTGGAVVLSSHTCILLHFGLWRRGLNT